MEAEFDRALSTILAREIPGFRALKACRRLTAGASQETCKLTLETDAGELLLALRRAQGHDAEASGTSLNLATEAALLQLANLTAVPVPRVIYVLQESDGLGLGFLMEWLEGETLGQRIVREDTYAEVRPQLARRCGEILGNIHAMDWRSEPTLVETLPETDTSTLIEETWQGYRELGTPAPMIDYCYRWLIDNIPCSERKTLVHGDFRNGNLMINAEGINAVLDWELSRVGDPIRDLGWLCVNSWRFGQTQLPVGGFGQIDDLLEGYKRTSGIEVCPEALKFWQVFGSFWWACTTLQMAQSWRSGDTPTLERPVIGRRSSEAQMDCVNLLIPGIFTLPEADRPASIGTQLPTPAELLSGVADFLKTEAAAKLEAPNNFLARVAANSLQIAQRELQYGPELAAKEELRLQTLLKSNDELDALRVQLVDALRDGMVLDTPGLQEHLRQTVAGQLFIDQPTYSALQSMA